MVLEDIHYPLNAEAVLRTCDAFGVPDVHFIFEKHPPFNPRRIGGDTSASANKWLTFHKHAGAENCLQQLEEKGYEIVATLLDEEDSESVFTADFSADKIALVLGNERDGLSEQVKKAAHRKIFIPMQGMVQSLNLSVTAAILLYEITRQRVKSGGVPPLSEQKQQALADYYIQREHARVIRKSVDQPPKIIE